MGFPTTEIRVKAWFLILGSVSRCGFQKGR